MQFVYSDGGRSKYFKADSVGDCVTRAICNATGKDYKEVYDRLNEMAKKESLKHHRGHQRSNSRNGVFKETWKRYLKEIGWVHHKTCELGSRSDKIKFVDGSLPKGILIVQLSRHLTCLKDGVIYDTYDCSKKDYYDWNTGDLVTNTERCVYGYWSAPTAEQQAQREEADKQIKEYKDFIKEKKAEVKLRQAEVRKYNQAIMKKYSKKINKLASELRKLERERDKKLLEMPKVRDCLKDSWAYANMLK